MCNSERLKDKDLHVSSLICQEEPCGHVWKLYSIRQDNAQLSRKLLHVLRDVSWLQSAALVGLVLVTFCHRWF